MSKSLILLICIVGVHQVVSFIAGEGYSSLDEQPPPPIEVTFRNAYESPVHIHHKQVAYDEFVFTLQPGEQASINAFLGAFFYAIDDQLFVRAIDMIVTYDGDLTDKPSEAIYTGVHNKFVIPAVWPPPPSSADSTDCEETTSESQPQRLSPRVLDSQPIEWKHRQNTELSRKQINREQPQRVPRFTPIGFEKREIPKNVFKTLLHVLETRGHLEVRENWPSDNTYVNHYDVPTTMIYVPDGEKRAIFEQLRPILEKWSSRELQATSLYGLRRYHNGSVLRNHVDRVATHAVSAILHVDDEMDRPWPLEIYDHAGVPHYEYLAPGEMMLYESASCIHGRALPFQGKSYVNVFVHFAPSTDWDYD